jgi:hypothetical protein
MTTTAIWAAVPRRPTILAGRVVALTLRFMGRTEVPGIVPGCSLRVEGTPWIDGDAFIMGNRLYEFMA